MSPEFDQKLKEDFPELFTVGVDIAVGDGWFDLIYTLCKRIQSHSRHITNQRQFALQWNKDVDAPTLEWNRYGERKHRTVPDEVPPVYIYNIKEKFGTLRISHGGGDDFIAGAIYLAEDLSGKICEICGSPGSSDTAKGWVKTLCDFHKEERQTQLGDIS